MDDCSGATAFDDVDGDITNDIVTSGDFPIDTSMLGVFTIFFVSLWRQCLEQEKKAYMCACTRFTLDQLLWILHAKVDGPITRVF